MQGQGFDPLGARVPQICFFYLKKIALGNGRLCVLSCFSCVQLFVTLWTVAHQAPLSMASPGMNTRVGCHTLLQGGVERKQGT